MRPSTRSRSTGRACRLSPSLIRPRNPRTSYCKYHASLVSACEWGHSFLNACGYRGSVDSRAARTLQLLHNRFSNVPFLNSIPPLRTLLRRRRTASPRSSSVPSPLYRPRAVSSATPPSSLRCWALRRRWTLRSSRRRRRRRRDCRSDCSRTVVGGSVSVNLVSVLCATTVPKGRRARNSMMSTAGRRRSLGGAHYRRRSSWGLSWDLWWQKKAHAPTRRGFQR